MKYEMIKIFLFMVIIGTIGVSTTIQVVNGQGINLNSSEDALKIICKNPDLSLPLMRKFKGLDDLNITGLTSFCIKTDEMLKKFEGFTQASDKNLTNGTGQ